MPTPIEIRLKKAERLLEIDYDDGRRFVLPAEYLRVESPSAEVQGHSPEERRLVFGKRTVAIIALEPVGHYAVRIVFDDGHDSGLYSWDYLYQLGREQERVWPAYLAELEKHGLSREA